MYLSSRCIPETAVRHKQVLWKGEWYRPGRFATRSDRPLWCIYQTLRDGTYSVQLENGVSEFKVPRSRLRCAKAQDASSRQLEIGDAVECKYTDCWRAGHVTQVGINEMAGDWEVQWKTTSSFFAPEEVKDDEEYMADEAAGVARRAMRDLIGAAAYRREVLRAQREKKLAAFLDAERRALTTKPPPIYDVDDVIAHMGRYAPTDLARLRREFQRDLNVVQAAVKITDVGVVHGHGCVAKRALHTGTELVDPTATYKATQPDQYQQEGRRSEAYMRTSDGIFILHWFLLDYVFKSSLTYFINEAATPGEANIAIISRYDNSRPVLRWKVIRDIRKGEELTYVYNPERSRLENDADDRRASQREAMERKQSQTKVSSFAFLDASPCGKAKRATQSAKPAPAAAPTSPPLPPPPPMAREAQLFSAKTTAKMPKALRDIGDFLKPGSFFTSMSSRKRRRRN